MVSHTNLHSGTDFVTMLVPLIRNADAQSLTLDLADCDAAEIYAMIGTNADTYSSTDNLQLELQESADDVTYTACADADLTNFVAGTNTGTFKKLTANADCSQTYAVGYRGSKRYLQVAVNFGGTHSTGTSIAILGVRGRKRIQPAQSFT